MEPISAILVTIGLVLLASSWILLLITSFQDDFTWGLSAVFVPPLAYFYGCFKWSKAGEAIMLAALGWLMIFLA